MNIEQYIEPIDAETPCGANAYDDVPYGNMLNDTIRDIIGGDDRGAVVGERAASGSADWNGLLAQVGGYFSVTKHLGLVFFASVADLRLSGVSGLADGLVLLNQFLSRHWDDVYPVIEDGDHDERVEFLNQFNDSLILSGIDEIEIAIGKRSGKYTFKDYKKSQKDSEADSQLIDSSINETLTEEPSFYSAQLEKVGEVFNQLEAIEEIVSEKLEENELNFSVVKAHLKEFESFLRAAEGGASVELDTNEVGEVNVEKLSSAASLTGDVRSRSDVIKVLDKIVRFYSQNEPASPVPQLLQRVKRMVNMNFVEILEEFQLHQISFDQDKVFGENINTNNQ